MSIHPCDMTAAVAGPDRPAGGCLGDPAALPRLRVRRCAHVLLVSAHLDEGLCAAGGLVAALSERGPPVTELAVTDGDGRHAGTATGSSARRLRERRARQPLTHQRLGLSQARRAALALPSGSVAAAQADVVAALSEIVGYGADPRTTVVLAPWRGDPHADHAAVGAAAALVCRAYGAHLVEYLVAAWSHSTAQPDPAVRARGRLFLLSPLLQTRKRHALTATLGRQLLPARRELFLDRVP